MGILNIHLTGSLQNPCWSPDGQSLVITRFRNGYNKAPADIFLVGLALVPETASLSTMKAPTTALVYDGNENVSEPGSTWNKATNEIVYSSDVHGRDQAFAFDMGTRKVVQLTNRSGMVWEPSWAPDGGAVVYEYHVTEDSGQIVVYDRKTRAYRGITAREHDCRQPCWSPTGGFIVYQRRKGEEWFLFLYSVKDGTTEQFTFEGDETDATFSPDGKLVIYSTGGKLMIEGVGERDRPIALGNYKYMGAPSISPNGKTVACEYSNREDPDGGPGTGIALIDLV